MRTTTSDEHSIARTLRNARIIFSTYWFKEDVLIFKEKGKVMLLGDFNAKVGTASEIDEVIGMFGEETSNNNGEKLVSFLTEVDHVSCNGHNFVTKPEFILASNKSL